MIKLKARELRTMKPTKSQLKRIKNNPVYIILDNILDTYNVGAIFRLADAVCAKEVILCGETEIPPHTRIKKASINTTEWVKWQYSPTAKSAIDDLRSKIDNLTVIAIEQHKKSVRYDMIDYRFPIALVVGHETKGVSKSALKMADKIVELPMWGVNVSLNVMVSLGIVLYKVMESKIRLDKNE